MKAQEQVAAFRRALERLEDALARSPDPIVRDSAILRFEWVFETAWKAGQTLAHEQGLLANSPRQALQAGFRLGWIAGEALWDEILRLRNSAVRVYHEALAQSLFDRLPALVPSFRQLLASLEGQGA
jgi:nucleotidyltransferase substrate binding protein (TIGR01987 family)